MVDYKKFKIIPEPDAKEYNAFNAKEKADFVELQRIMHNKYKGKFDEFVQVECGYKHTLLLNKMGQVFAFGEGLQG